MQPAKIVYKPGTSSPTNLHESMEQALKIAAAVWGEWVQEMVVTSMNDGTHRVGSLHYSNKAADIRTKNLPTTEAKRLAVKKLASRLGRDYVVILESLGGVQEHCHVQYNDD